MNRERQIELLAGVKERLSGYVAKWIADPKVKAALHRPVEEPEDAPTPRRAACG